MSQPPSNQATLDPTVQRVIESGRQTIERVNGVLRQWEELKTRYKLDPDQLIEGVRRIGGDQAVAEVQAEADRLLSDIRQQVEQESMHQSRPVKPTQLVRRGRRSLI